MLSEAVLENMDSQPKQPKRGFSLSSVSPCPMRTWYSILNIEDPQEVTPLSRLVMEDGEFQEQSVLYWLRKAGFTIFFTGKEQMTLHTGRLNIPGHPDGILILQGAPRILEVKGMNSPRFSNARYSGLEKHQSIRCQVQSYMHSWEIRDLGITKTQIYFKHKETSRPHDLEVVYEPNWIGPIIDRTCDILDGTFIPKPEEIPMCTGCSKSSTCWPDRATTVDLTNIDVASMPDIEEKYDQGKYMESIGKMLKDEAREEFIKRMGESDQLILNSHRIQRIIFYRKDFNRSAFISKFGAENLDQVIKPTKIEQFRVYDTSGESE